ncbi:MAG: bifunctional [glutamate--ammonia ligase]-adenylyl-L-tyrosine phosphorylase/[glutamate--ammonia-ligase] adenylyltransferase, partial [Deltaproteobacteria bacterium]|nr:bifunctional [glutamate--ammonia ligase]-adenylyl-L-tyrosine phosphorylase/[glutamate--ammonia-ligase] adenylyltransferase [Deltaproteobacteria bacterium]
VKEAEFAVIGLGKLGGRELNFSSDIDIIYIYSSDKGETAGVEGKEASTRISLHDFFVKLSVMVTRLMAGVTEDGFVFRTDLDLRPEGRGGDMANSLRSAEIYYESWGKSWERAAMIKARPVAGSLAVGEGFLSMIRPFVYRRYLDFTAIEEIKSMKERIDLSLLRRAPDAVDVKLGAGGIREIEFFLQALQLIHGGKDKDVREKNTLKAVEKLRDKGFIKEEDARLLSDGYIFLRSLEHRIQIVDERQSHAIPAKPHELTRLARMMGFADTEAKPAGEQFWDEYRKKTSSVHGIYRTLFYKETSFKDIPGDILTLLSPDIPEDEAVIILSRLGFKDPEAAHKNISMIRNGPLSRRLFASAQVLLQRLLPVFIAKASAAPDPDRALLHLERFISAIGGRTAFYALLSENPAALDELVKLFGTSVFLSRGLIDHPENRDILLSKELSIPYKKKEAVLEAFLKESLDPAKDYEERLDSLRRMRNQEIMRIGMNDTAGGLNQHQVSIQITFLAEVCLEAAYRVALDELKRLVGIPPKGSSFTVLGLGKLGGRELIYGSDLDIVFVYEDAPSSGDAPYAGDANQRKDGGNHEFFIKLGQRIISILTLRTREGFLFNVDTRLRPSGSSGPLVVSLSSIINYHKGKTMIWE